MCLDGTIESDPNDREGRMLAEKESDLQWVVVKVESGMPVDVQTFSRLEDAKQQEDEWRLRMNPDNDETGIFETRVQ